MSNFKETINKYVTPQHWFALSICVLIFCTGMVFGSQVKATEDQVASDGTEIVAKEEPVPAVAMTLNEEESSSTDIKEEESGFFSSKWKAFKEWLEDEQAPVPVLEEKESAEPVTEEAKPITSASDDEAPEADKLLAELEEETKTKK